MLLLEVADYHVGDFSFPGMMNDACGLQDWFSSPSAFDEKNVLSPPISDVLAQTDSRILLPVSAMRGCI